MNKIKQFNPVHAKDFLFISDLDGTLLYPDGTLPKESKIRLNRLIEGGMKFTIPVDEHQQNKKAA